MPTRPHWRGRGVRDTVELRGPPYSSTYQAGAERQPVARVTTSGRVKTVEIGKSAAKLLRAGQPAYGERSQTKWQWGAGALSTAP